jgi:hypothetical protein
MAVFIAGIGAAKAKPKAKTKAKAKKQIPVFHYHLYKYEEGGKIITKEIKIRRMNIYSARTAMEDYIIKLRKTKPGFYKFELDRISNDEGLKIA